MRRPTPSRAALYGPPPERSSRSTSPGPTLVHSFNIPQLGIRLDAIPGRVNMLAFNVPNAPAGTGYLIQCTEFCGTFHGTMRSFLDIV